MTRRRVSFGDARAHLLRWSDSYSRLKMIFHLFERMAYSDWLRLLGENWSTCDNIAEWVDELRDVLEWEFNVEVMMTPDELAMLRSLPETVTVYRGCGPENTDGICWSLDPEVARNFPYYHRYRVDKPLLVTGTVARPEIVALKLDRTEAEIISFRVHPVSSARLSRYVKRPG